MTTSTARRVTANLSITLDGRYHGPGGPADLAAIVPYATTEVARRHLARIWDGATTAVLGRVNAEGFLSYWPTVAGDEAADARDRGYAQWLEDTEKVVLSRTLTTAPWKHARIVDAPVAEVLGELRTAEGGDILINSSPSIIAAALAAGALDRLHLMICPEVVGGGERLFEDGLPSTRWRLAHQETGELGEMSMVYDRVH